MITSRETRSCGAHRECVVYWTVSLDAPECVVDVVHPEHTSTPWHYEVADRWLGAFMVDLYRDRRTVRAQVHTHCDAAFHSPTDDMWPLVHTPGFLSLVLPRFAREPLSTASMYLAVIGAEGWHECDPGEHIGGLP